MGQPSKMQSIADGTGALSYLLWIVVIGGFLYLFLPDGSTGTGGVLWGILVGLKMESNGLKKRVSDLEVAHRSTS